MDIKAILLDRFNSETKKLQLLKDVELSFSSVPIMCESIFVTELSRLKKKGYETIPLYQELESVTGPIVYYYKFINSSEETVRNAFQKFKECKKRNCSALPKRTSSIKTNTLYVGSDRNSLKRRTMEHMGYAHEHTGGLQISRWAPAISLQLVLYYAQIQQEHLPVLRQVETALALHLDPLIGRHEKY